MYSLFNSFLTLINQFSETGLKPPRHDQKKKTTKPPPPEYPKKSIYHQMLPLTVEKKSQCKLTNIIINRKYYCFYNTILVEVSNDKANESTIYLLKCRKVLKKEIFGTSSNFLMKIRGYKNNE